MNLDFFMGSNIYVYLFIFFGKILEVAIATVRMVLINRGERVTGSIIAFFESVIWILVTGTVLAGFREDVIKIVLYCAAFAIGNFTGSWLEGKLAIGLNTIQVITSDNDAAKILASELRNSGLGVTMLDSEGKEGKKKLLMVHLKRAKIPTAIRIINKIDPQSVITTSEVKRLRGGFIKK